MLIEILKFCAFFLHSNMQKQKRKKAFCNKSVCFQGVQYERKPAGKK